MGGGGGAYRAGLLLQGSEGRAGGLLYSLVSVKDPLQQLCIQQQLHLLISTSQHCPVPTFHIPVLLMYRRWFRKLGRLFFFFYRGQNIFWGISRGQRPFWSLNCPERSGWQLPPPPPTHFVVFVLRWPKKLERDQRRPTSKWEKTDVTESRSAYLLRFLLLPHEGNKMVVRTKVERTGLS
jgi:hypothetical protein